MILKNNKKYKQINSKKKKIKIRIQMKIKRNSKKIKIYKLLNKLKIYLNKEISQIKVAHNCQQAVKL